MSVCCGIDQLGGNAHPVSTLSHRAFEHVAHAQFATNLLHVDGLALVRKARIAGDDEQPADARERGDDLLDHAVGEIFLLGVARHVLKRQHRDRRLIGERQCGDWKGCQCVGVHPIHPDRLRDVLYLLFPEVVEGQRHLVTDVIPRHG